MLSKCRFKSFLALALAAAMVLGSSYQGQAYAAETEVVEEQNVRKAPIWEKVDDSEAVIEDVTELEIAADEAVEEEPLYADDEIVRVFIVFEDAPVIEAGFDVEDAATDNKAVAYAERLAKTQENVINKIEKKVLDGEELETRYSFTLLTNAVSAEIPFGLIPEIEAVDGVEAVHIVPVYEAQQTYDPQTMTSGEMVGSYTTWSNGYTGAGMRIAVIDTGLDTDHPSFTEGGFLYALNETAEKNGKTVADYNLLTADEINGVIDSLNAKTMYPSLTGEDAYLTAKVPFAFNYVDESLDVTHDHDSQGDHGTHVAGISTANKYVPDGEGYSRQALGVVGIAPDAQLFVMKVFGKGGGANTDDYMAAIEDAIMLGADTINLSLGSSNPGETSEAEQYINDIMAALEGTSTVVAISAGNASYWSEASSIGLNLTGDVDADTVGSPGSYTNAFTVASAVNSGYTGTAFMAQGEVQAFYQDGNDAPNLPLETLDTTGNGTEYDYVLIPGYGEETDFEGLDVKDKIVLVSRGSINFSKKHTYAAEAGAKAVVVYNNTSGTISMTLSGSTATIPCASITQADAMAMAELSDFDEATGTYTGKITIVKGVFTNFNAADGFLMSDFSSWGVPGDLQLKPEITAPGGNIYSTLDNGTYGNKSGTSMAAPSIAGLSALVLQYIEENDLANKTGLSARTLAQSLIMSTATPLVQEDGEYYSPRKQGAGLANANYATQTPAYILVDSETGKDGKVKIELGDDPERTGAYNFDFTVYNMSNDKVYYTFDETFLTESVIADLAIANSSYRLNPKVTIKTNSEQYLYDINADGKVNINDAYSLLKVVNKKNDYSIIKSFMDKYDFNDNGIVDTDDVATFYKALRCPRKYNIDLKEKVFVVKDKANVSVSVKLSKEDKAYIEGNFENGMYVEGFVKLDGIIDLSVPVLAFYGNWTDSSMFEPFDYIATRYGDEDQFTYSGIEKTNYITYKFAGESKGYEYDGNLFVNDDEYIADRNAISSLSGDSIDSITYSLIRNAADVKALVTNAETGEVYSEFDRGAQDGAFYHETRGEWMFTSSSMKLNWKGTDAEGEPLEDGTKVNISVEALPSYYNDGTHTPGKGISFSIPFVIDNTAPEAELVDYTDYEKDASGNNVSNGTMTFAVQDNRYVAAAFIVDRATGAITDVIAPNQTEAGVPTEITMEYPESVFYVVVLDYAGNMTQYRVNMSGIEDTNICDSIAISDESIFLIKGSSAQLEAVVGPLTLVDDSVNWYSDDETVAIVDEDGIVTGVGEGVTNVYAVSNAVNAEGEHLVAICEVEVMAISVDLNATVWDEHGHVHFATFNTDDMVIKNLSEEQDVDFWAATLNGDDMLFAATSGLDDPEAAQYYLVDPDTFESTLISENNIASTDFAYGYATDDYYGTYAYFVTVVNSKGEFEGAYNLSTVTEGNYLTGIAYEGLGYSRSLGYYDYFYAIDETGVVYELQILRDGRIGYGVIGETGISTEGEIQYDSLYYDFATGIIFYTCYDGTDQVKLYALLDDYNSETEEDTVYAYRLGEFAPDVWPVSGLYKYNNVTTQASATAGHSISGISSIAKVLEVTPINRTASAKTPVLAQKAAPVIEEAAPVIEEENVDVSENDAAPVEETTEEETSAEETAVEEGSEDNDSEPED